MLGALVGLLGGGGGGSGAPEIKGYSARAPQTSRQAPEPQEQQQQTAPEQQQAAPEEQPRMESPAQDAPVQLATKQPDLQQEAPKSPLSDLLPETKPQAEPDVSRQAGEVGEIPDIVNRTDSKSPVAPILEQQFGEVPRTLLTDLLPNRLFDAGTNKQPHQWQEGMPAKHFQTDSEKEPPMGLQYQQTSTVAGSVPARKYRA